MPSAAILEQKKTIVENLANQMKEACSCVIVNYQGISVEDDTKLRAELRKAGVEYKVIKNTLISRACEIAGYEGLKGVLNGMSAIAFCNADQVSAAKILNEYAKKHDNFEIKAGFYDGKIADAEEMKKLAELPSKDILLATVLSAMNGPIRGLAVALQAIVDKKEEA
jgi:large subunit ribosomal protein L10